MDSVEETVTYENYSVTVRPATVAIGMYRSVLINQAVQEEGEPSEGDDLQTFARRILHTMIYPSLIAATVKAEGFEHWPLTFSEFQELPEQFEASWEVAVYNHNQHWKPKVPPTEAEKKSKTSSG
jgi:hypothetical protein